MSMSDGAAFRSMVNGITGPLAQRLQQSSQQQQQYSQQPQYPQNNSFYGNISGRIARQLSQPQQQQQYYDQQQQYAQPQQNQALQYQNDFTNRSQQLLKESDKNGDGQTSYLEYALHFGKDQQDVQNKFNTMKAIDFSYNSDGTINENTGGDGVIDKRDLSAYLVALDKADGNVNGLISENVVKSCESQNFGDNKVLNNIRTVLRQVHNFFTANEAQNAQSSKNASAEPQNQLTDKEKAEQIVNSYLQGDTNYPKEAVLEAAKLCNRENEIK